MYCLWNSNKKKNVCSYVPYRYNHHWPTTTAQLHSTYQQQRDFFSNIFDPNLVETKDTESAEMQSQLYIYAYTRTVYVCVCVLCRKHFYLNTLR